MLNQPFAKVFGQVDGKIFKHNLPLLYTSPFQVLAIVPCSVAPGSSPFASKVLYLDLPSGPSGTKLEMTRATRALQDLH